jgi:p-hydroxybenzoate 3-monooxygenase
LAFDADQDCRALVKGTRRTQVCIVGAGPAGLMLAHLLHREGVDSVVLEIRSREYVENRVRAGVLEQGTADLLRAAGVGERMTREGLVHYGINLNFGGERHRIDFADLTGGKGITVYGQQEVVKDLIAARLAAGGEVQFEAEAVGVEGFLESMPVVTYRQGGEELWLECDFVAGCDGFHGVSRTSLPGGRLSVYERSYPYAWLGILATTPPATEELIYAYHERGFSLHSMRTPEISRLYLQVDADDELDAWPEARIWEELRERLGEPGLREGPVREKGITPMRSYVVEPMQCGRLFLAGDAAHIVPPTGAKGMNLAINDARVLAAALADWYRSRSDEHLRAYSETCLRRVWRAEHFSYWMTTMLHRDIEGDPFEHKLRISSLNYLVRSRAAATSLAENYVGLAPA